MEDKAFKNITDYMKQEGDEKGYDDWHYLTDEELLQMNPISDKDIAFSSLEGNREYSAEDLDRLVVLEKQLRDVLDDIANDELAVKSTSNYVTRSELYADIRDSRIRQTRILQEMDEIKAKYDRDSRSL